MHIRRYSGWWNPRNPSGSGSQRRWGPTAIHLRVRELLVLTVTLCIIAYNSSESYLYPYIINRTNREQKSKLIQFKFSFSYIGFCLVELKVPTHIALCSTTTWHIVVHFCSCTFPGFHTCTFFEVELRNFLLSKKIYFEILPQIFNTVDPVHHIDYIYYIFPCLRAVLWA